MNTLTYNGREYQVEISADECSGRPWEECDGHGPVRESRRSHRSQGAGKSPGERPLNAAGRDEFQFFYDWQGAMKLALADGWNSPPYDVPGETRRQRAARAVQADFDYLRRYLDEQWFYAVVTVSYGDYGVSMGMIEYDPWADHWQETARELAGEVESQILERQCLLHTMLKATRAQLRAVAREVRANVLPPAVCAVLQRDLETARDNVRRFVAELRELNGVGVKS